MRPVAIVACGAVSPLGIGRRAFAVGPAGAVAESAVADDPELRKAGLAKPFVARVPAGLTEGRAEDRAELLLELAVGDLVRDLERRVPDFRERRIAVCLGTSAGGMVSLERAAIRLASGAPVPAALARAALYDGPLAPIARELQGPRVQILGACASSTIAVGLGCRWLALGRADLVIAGGYDALSELVAFGFEALGATTGSVPQPFRRARDGMALGEGAALVALARHGEAPARLGYVLGFGTTGDAVHVTAPDPSGAGLLRAAQKALDDAGLAPDAIELVSAHATATPHNDSAEVAALDALFSERQRELPVHPFKAVIGHALGAAGVLEMLAACDAMQRGVVPAALGEGPLEPDFLGSLAPANLPGSARIALKLSAGFGGINAALVLGSEPRELSRAPEGRSGIRLLSLGPIVVEPALERVAARSAVERERLRRISDGGALAATAVVEASSNLELGDGGAVALVVGSASACLDQNARVALGRRSRAGAIEPRAFVRTSPNLSAAECAIAFGFRGPAFAVGGGPGAMVEALLVASDLLAGGDAERVVVVACESGGEHARALFEAAGLEAPVRSARAAVLAPGDATFRRAGLEAALASAGSADFSLERALAVAFGDLTLEGGSTDT